MTKAQLRQAVRQRQNSLPSSCFETAGKIIAEKVIVSEAFLRASNLFIYISTPLEPCTRPIIEAAWKSGKNVCVPRCNPDHTMNAVPIHDYLDLRTGYHGISEPLSGIYALPPEVIDLAVVPCLAADQNGHRLGHGGGFYDRFLKNTPTWKVCLCFDLFLMDDLPVSGLDVSMDAVITESRFFRLTKN